MQCNLLVAAVLKSIFMEDDFVEPVKVSRRAVDERMAPFDKEDVMIARALSLSQSEKRSSDNRLAVRSGATTILPPEEAFVHIAQRASDMILSWSET